MRPGHCPKRSVIRARVGLAIALTPDLRESAVIEPSRTRHWHRAPSSSVSGESAMNSFARKAVAILVAVPAVACAGNGI